MKIEGREIADEIITQLKKQETPDKKLAVILVGKDKRSVSFIRQKERAAEELGIKFETRRLNNSLNTDEIASEIEEIATDDSIGGIVVQLPLPENVERRSVLRAIPHDKDVDVLGEEAVRLFKEDKSIVLPPSVATVKEILKRASVDLEKSAVAVVGSGALIGGPILTWLKGKCSNLISVERGTGAEKLKEADVVISGVGKANLIDPSILKDGAGVIDFGYYYFPNGDVSGDLKLEKKELERLSFYTPTPGGTGPILVAKLLQNFYTLCKG